MMLLSRFKMLLILFLCVFANIVQSQVLCEATSSVNMDIDLSGLKPPKGGWSEDVVVKLSSSKYLDVCKVRVIDMVKGKAPCRVPIKYIQNGRNEFAMIIYSVVSGHVYANMDASFHVDDETAFVKGWDIGDIGLNEAILGAATISALSGLATLLWINQGRVTGVSGVLHHVVSSFSGPKPPKPGPSESVVGPMSISSDSTTSPSTATKSISFSSSSSSLLVTYLSIFFRELSGLSKLLTKPLQSVKARGSAVVRRFSPSRQYLFGIAGLLLVINGRPPTASLPSLKIPGFNLAPVGHALGSTSSAVLQGLTSAPGTVIEGTKAGLKTVGDSSIGLGGLTLGGVKALGGALGATLGAMAGLLKAKQRDAQPVPPIDSGLASSGRGYSGYTRSKRPSRPASYFYSSKDPLPKAFSGANTAAKKKQQEQSKVQLPSVKREIESGTVRLRASARRASSSAKPHSRDHHAKFSLDREFGVSVKDSDISYFLTKEAGARGASISTLQTMTNLVWAFLTKKIVSVIMGEKAPI